jgi:YggT family protein
VSSLLCAFLTVYLLVLLGRAIFSWFPPGEPGSFSFGLSRLLFDLTEPVLAPVRRMIPPAGMFDLSFIVVMVGLFILREALCR